MAGLLSSANEGVYGATGLDITGGHAAKEGLEAQQAAAAQASAVQKYMYDQTRADNAPWHDVGAKSINELSASMPDLNRSFTMADFQADPSYDFRMQEGQKALERSAAARGGRHGIATMKALTDYGQNMASTEYSAARGRFMEDQTNRFNRLSSLAGTGQTANAQTGQAGQNYANQTGQNMMGAANAQAAYGQQQQGMTMGMIGAGAGIYAGQK